MWLSHQVLLPTPLPLRAQRCVPQPRKPGIQHTQREHSAAAVPIDPTSPYKSWRDHQLLSIFQAPSTRGTLRQLQPQLTVVTGITLLSARLLSSCFQASPRQLLNSIDSQHNGKMLTKVQALTMVQRQLKISNNTLLRGLRSNCWTVKVFDSNKTASR